MTQRRIPTGKQNIGRDLTRTVMYVIDSDHDSSSPVISDLHSEYSSASTYRGGSTSTSTTGHSVQLASQGADIQTSATAGDHADQFPIQDREDSENTESSPVGRLSITPTTIEDQLRCEDPVMQISGVGHWCLEGWIGGHSVEFLVDSGSSVTAMSDSFYQILVHTGAPLGTLQYTARTLRSTNGTGIEVSGCSRCVVSFMGLQTEFPIIICNHTLWTLKMAYCLQAVVPHSNCTGGIQLFPAVFSRWATPQYHHIRKLCCIALFELPAVGRSRQVACWRG